MLFAGSINWERFAEIARFHRMTPIVYRHLSQFFPEAVPHLILKKMRNEYHGNFLNALFLTEELLRLLTRLSAEGIRVLPYKGPVLAQTLYGDITLRMAGDLDLVVQASNVVRAEEVLVSCGYSSLCGIDNTMMSKNYHCQFLHNDLGTQVELHWGLAPASIPFAIGLNSVWDRLEFQQFYGRDVLIFSPEDLLIILCVHGTKHRWRQLRWACDIAELMRRYPALDWNCVFDYSYNLGCSRYVALGVAIASDLFDVSPPETDYRKLWTNIPRLVEIIYEDLFDIHNSPPNFIRDAPYQFLLHEKFKDRLMSVPLNAIGHLRGKLSRVMRHLGT